MMEATTSSPAETESFGRKLAGTLRPGDVVALFGTLGTGKTRLVTGLCEGLGVSARVSSPTFTLVNEYASPFGSVVHIDLYRIASARELSELGVQEYFNDRTICFIEWPELVLPLLPPDHLTVRMSHGAANEERRIIVEQRAA